MVPFCMITRLCSWTIWNRCQRFFDSPVLSSKRKVLHLVLCHQCQTVFQIQRALSHFVSVNSKKPHVLVILGMSFLEDLNFSQQHPLNEDFSALHHTRSFCLKNCRVPRNILHLTGKSVTELGVFTVGDHPANTMACAAAVLRLLSMVALDTWSKA